MELPAWFWVIVMSIVVPLVAQGIKWVADKRGVELHRGPITIVAAVLAFISAGVVVMPQLPAYEDPMQYIGALISVATTIYGVATFTYNIILGDLLVRLGFAPDFQKEGYAGRYSD